jgi:hypothetical protein
MICWIIEDDYKSEFRQWGGALPPLQGLAAALVQPVTHTHPATQSDWGGRPDPTSSNLTPRPNPHRARGTDGAPTYRDFVSGVLDNFMKFLRNSGSFVVGQVQVHGRYVVLALTNTYAARLLAQHKSGGCSDDGKFWLIVDCTIIEMNKAHRYVSNVCKG